MPERFCKTCKFLRVIHEDDLEQNPQFLCSYTVTVPAPWPFNVREVNFSSYISPRHVIPGNYYAPDSSGSTADWTEQMDCPVHEERKNA